MLMARPPDREPWQHSCPGNVQLPSFSSLMSKVEQSHSASQRPTFAKWPESLPGPPRGPSFQAHINYHQPQAYQHRPLQSSSPQHHVAINQFAQIPTQQSQNRGPDQGTLPITSRLTPSPTRVMSIATSSPTPSSLGEASKAKEVVAESMIEGKGLCYVYSDGTTCQKYINGDTVNPKWGTTKAGKPRKRLGQACNTCREKKIRCDPQVPKCTQCQKFGRECKFESNPRGSSRPGLATILRGSSITTEGAQEPLHERKASSTSGEASTDVNSARSSVAGEQLLSPPSTVRTVLLEDPPPAKRAKSFPAGEASGADQLHERPVNRLLQNESSSAKFSITVDPFAADPRLVERYLRHYFSYVNDELCQLFPTDQFLKWVKTSRSKSSGEHMLLYAMLALGSMFATTGSNRQDCAVFSAIAEAALDVDAALPSLQSIQAALVLSVLRFSTGNIEGAIILASWAHNKACWTGLNSEQQLADGSPSRPNHFGFNLATSQECQRRTFWSAYIIDCFYGYISTRRDSILPKCYLRLPCKDAGYGLEAASSETIMETRDASHDLPKALGVSKTALVVQAAIYFSRVISLMKDLADVREPGEERSFSRRASDLDIAATAWLGDVHKSPKASKHLIIMAHFSLMILHRHLRHRLMTEEETKEHCERSYHHARELLHTLQELQSDYDQRMQTSTVAASWPTYGYAIMAAIDVISSAGTISSVLEHQTQKGSNLVEMMTCGIRALEDLSTCWRTAEEQLHLVQERLNIIFAATKSTPGSKKAFYIRRPMYTPWGLEQDVVFGTPRLFFLHAISKKSRHEVRSDSDLCEIG